MRSDGLADLTFAVRDGRTRLTRSVTRPPLRVQRCLYLDDALPDLAFVYLANPTAGIFAGDTLSVAVRVEPGARAHVTTQAATKVHRMPEGCAAQETRLVVEEGAWLEYLPDPVIPYRGSSFRQHTEIVVAPGGVVIYGEVLTPGRVAMGERFAYRRLAQSLTIESAGGRLLFQESYLFGSDVRMPFGPGLLDRDGAQVLGTLAIVTDALPARELRDCLRARLRERPGTLAGVSVLPGGGGLCLKVLGPDVAAVRAEMDIAWAAVRRRLLSVSRPDRRKY